METFCNEDIPLDELMAEREKKDREQLERDRIKLDIRTLLYIASTKELIAVKNFIIFMMSMEAKL